MPRPLITLLTDFGTRDAYVASLKGVILAINPEAGLVDITHQVPPQDVRAGAFLLVAAAPYFPPGTIHLAVVDPEVGSSRRALAARSQEQFFVGPDNGLFHLIFSQASEPAIVALTNRAYFRPQVSATFHGRDIFAPVAAHLSRGVDLSQLGSPVIDPVALPLAVPLIGPERLRGEVIHVDHFGNLITNIRARDLESWLQCAPFRLRAGGIELEGLAQAYAEAAAGKFLALIGSFGFLEIACAMGNAAHRLQAGVGLEVVIEKI